MFELFFQIKLYFLRNYSYGGYLLDINPMMKKSDIFIIVLSMALIVDSISTATTDYCFIKKAIRAALYIWNLRQFDHQFMVKILILIKVDQRNYSNFPINFFEKFLSFKLSPECNRRCSMDGITVTLITVPEFKKSVTSPEGNSIIRFISGTRSVLRNYHNHKLFLVSLP